MEEWFARVDEDGKPTCLMGHTQSFPRRKKDAECFLKQEFKHAVAKTEKCKCTDKDYECDFNFAREDGKCVAKGPIIPPDGVCRDAKPDDTFKGTSGYRKIPGNSCEPTEEMDDKYKDVDRKCSELAGTPSPSTPATDEIEQTQKSFEEDWDAWEKHYLERGDSSSSEGETVIMRGKKGSKFGPIYITDDHGKKWHSPKDLKDEKIIGIVPHPTFKDMVYFVTTGKKVIYTTDRGRTFHSFKAPTEASPGQNPLTFHPDKKHWLIWVGKECESDDDCFGVASFTKDGGDHWRPAGLDGRYVQRCEFTGSSAYKYPGRKEEQIICLKREKKGKSKDNPMVLVSTSDWFDNEKVRATNVKDFATMSEFIVVATEDTEKETLQASASLDGTTFAAARFPYGFEVPHQLGYTVLDCSTHAVNLFVATEIAEGRGHGTILKSNSNGTTYGLSVKNVNSNDEGYVDFEKMFGGVQGVALVNVVANPDEKGSAPKRLQSKITHNDGSQWAYLAPPPNDDFGKFSCQSKHGDEKCALHIHGYTERRDFSRAYSSRSAVGIMFAWGNVGEALGPQKDADTFMTADAGITWKRVKQGRWTWAIGDQGSVIVLAQTTDTGHKKTKTITYSLDQGESWKDHEFSSDEVAVWDVTTMRAGASRNFLLWGKDDKGAFTLNLDFSGFSERVCKVDDDAEKSDYYLWSPRHPMQEDGCLFGHVSQYLRKKADRKCYNDFRLQALYGEQTCACSREDYEW
jgi:hypothetical protein